MFILLCFPFIIIHYILLQKEIEREKERETEKERKAITASTHIHMRRKSIGQIFLRRYVYYGVHICYPRGPYYDKYQIEWRERCLFPYNCLTHTSPPGHRTFSIEQRNTCTVSYGAKKNTRRIRFEYIWKIDNCGGYDDRFSVCVCGCHFLV